MRQRKKIIQSLETVYREAYSSAEAANQQERMDALDLGFQRDQLLLEVLLDVREALTNASGDKDSDPSLLDRAKAVRKFTKLGR